MTWALINSYWPLGESWSGLISELFKTYSKVFSRPIVRSFQDLYIVRSDQDMVILRWPLIATRWAQIVICWLYIELWSGVSDYIMSLIKTLWFQTLRLAETLIKQDLVIMRWRWVDVIHDCPHCRVFSNWKLHCVLAYGCINDRLMWLNLVKLYQYHAEAFGTVVNLAR